MNNHANDKIKNKKEEENKKRPPVTVARERY